MDGSARRTQVAQSFWTVANYCVLTNGPRNSVGCTKREQNSQCTYNVTLRRVRVTIVVVEKQSVLHILCVCVCVCVCVCRVDLGIQHAMRMRHIVICGLPGFTIFYHNLINGHNFPPPPKKKNVTKHKMYVLIFSTTFI